MTSRERALRALNGQEADRVPVDFGGTVVTCLDSAARRSLQHYLGLPENDPGPIIDYTMGTVAPTEEIMRLMGSDFRRVGLNFAPPKIKEGMYEDGFGMILRQASPHEYFDVVRHPLAEACVEDLDRMKNPDPEDPELYSGLRDKARDLFENSPYCVVADFGVPGFFETGQKLRGYEQFAVDLLTDQGFIRALFDRLLALQKRFFTRYLEAVAGYVQIIGYADDLGMQDRPQISPVLYRTMIKPYHQEIFNFIKNKADIKILLHCCGAIAPLVDDLIEAGVDILNPVQTRAAGMEPSTLKKNFGGRLSFWGGLDEQVILPQATPEAVAEEARRLLRELGPGGGYVFAPSHNIQSDTPPANVVAMYRAAMEYGSYPCPGFQKGNPNADRRRFKS